MILAFALAALAGYVGLARKTAAPVDEPAPRPLWARVPPGAILLVELDLSALRRHPVGAELLGQGREIAGLGPVAEICDRDPLTQIDRIALAVPELEGVGFGLFATGSFEAEGLVACAAEIVRRRGGTPVRATEAGHSVLRDASLETESAELAVRDGALVLAEPAYLRQALAHEGDAANGAHGELRQLVPPGIVVATAVLSEAQRRTLIDELRAQGQLDSPLASLRDGAVSIRLAEALTAEAAVRCASAEACARVAEQLIAGRDELAGRPTYRLLGVADLLGAVAVTPAGDQVSIEATVALERLVALLDRLRLLEQLSRPAASTASPRPTATVPRDEGERIPARKSP